MEGSTKIIIDSSQGVVNRLDFDTLGNLRNQTALPQVEMLWKGKFLVNVISCYIDKTSLYNQILGVNEICDNAPLWQDNCAAAMMDFSIQRDRIDFLNKILDCYIHTSLTSSCKSLGSGNAATGLALTYAWVLSQGGESYWFDNWIILYDTATYNKEQARRNIIMYCGNKQERESAGSNWRNI